MIEWKSLSLSKLQFVIHEVVKHSQAIHSNNSSNRWDDFGMLTSALCLVHCMVMPLCFTLIPASLAPFVGHNDCTHYVLAVWVILFCGLGILPRLLRKPDRKVAFLMGSGLSLVIGCTVFEHFVEDWHMEILVMTAGNLMVIAAHWLNKKKSCC